MLAYWRVSRAYRVDGLQDPEHKPRVPDGKTIVTFHVAVEEPTSDLSEGWFVIFFFEGAHLVQVHVLSLDKRLLINSSMSELGKKEYH